MAKAKAKAYILKIGSGFVFLAIISAMENHWQSASTLGGLGLVMFFYHVGLIAEHKCGGFAKTTLDGVCGNSRPGGLLKGCPKHPWWRLNVLLGREASPDEQRRAWRAYPGHTPARAHPVGPRQAAMTVSPPVISSVAQPSATLDPLALWCTIIGTLTGTLSFIVGAIGLAVQLSQL